MSQHLYSLVCAFMLLCLCWNLGSSQNMLELIAALIFGNALIATFAGYVVKTLGE